MNCTIYDNWFMAHTHYCIYVLCILYNVHIFIMYTFAVLKYHTNMALFGQQYWIGYLFATVLLCVYI